METYVVRVYRRDPARPTEIVGIVEWIGAGSVLHFHNAEELSAILIQQREHKPKGGRAGERGNSAKRNAHIRRINRGNHER